jgi:agmatinase
MVRYLPFHYKLPHIIIVRINLNILDLGDIIVKPDDSPENLFQKIGLCTDMIVSKNALPVFFGGDHSISAPIIESLARRHADLTVIHLDAHTDLASWTHGKTHHHGSFMSRVLKKAGISEVYHYGMRGFSGEPYSCKQDCAIKYRYCSTKQLDAAFLNDTWQELIPVGKTCYISLDIDILDPVFAPGVGTPVPFGLEPKKLCSILEALATKNKMVGFDIVELCPPRDVGMMTAHLAFHLTTSLLSWSWDK